MCGESVGSPSSVGCDRFQLVDRGRCFAHFLQRFARPADIRRDAREQHADDEHGRGGHEQASSDEQIHGRASERSPQFGESEKEP